MSELREELERLKASLLTRPAGAGETDVDPGEIWDAVEGRLPPERVASLASRALADPGLFQEWCLARELAAQRRRGEPAPPVRLWRRPLVLALAALLVVAVGLPLLLRQMLGGPPRYRGPAAAAIQRVGGPGPLPRDRFVLRWRSTVSDARFDVVVSDGRLHVLATASGLTATRFTVPPEALAGVKSGDTVLWQVWAVTPAGRRLAGPTFVERLE